MPKHSEAPWERGPEHESMCQIVSGQKVVATLKGGSFVLPNQPQYEEREANVTLVLAAPAMLQTLKDLKFWFETNKRDGSIMYPRVCGAIAKAESPED